MKMMRVLIVAAGASLLAVGLIGCSFSASASTDGKAVLKGKDKIMVAAEQPAPPPPPPPPAPVVVVQMKAKLVGKKIEITEKVQFEVNKAVIKVDSDQLLKDIYQVITEHPEITKLEIAGHTSSEGKAKRNKELSQQRADAVKAYLVKLGVSADKLTAIGYGPDKPIGDNKTTEGKELNRRVEFIVTGRSDNAEEPQAEAPQAQ